MSDTVVGTLLREVEWIRRRLDALHRIYPFCGSQRLRQRLNHEQKFWLRRCQEIERCHVRLKSGVRIESLQRQLLQEQLKRAQQQTSRSPALETPIF